MPRDGVNSWYEIPISIDSEINRLCNPICVKEPLLFNTSGVHIDYGTKTILIDKDILSENDMKILIYRIEIFNLKLRLIDTDKYVEHMSYLVKQKANDTCAMQDMHTLIKILTDKVASKDELLKKQQAAIDGLKEAIAISKYKPLLAEIG